MDWNDIGKCIYWLIVVAIATDSLITKKKEPMSVVFQLWASVLCFMLFTMVQSIK